MAFPTDVDNFSDPATTDRLNSPSHSGLHTSINAAVEAIETKLGTGISTPANNTFLIGDGSGTSSWSAITSAQLRARLSDETGSGSAVFANTPTLVTPEIGAATGTSLALGGGTALTTTNRTGTGNLVLASSPTITTPTISAPTIADFTNANHDHGDADDGGILANSSITNAMLSTSAGEIGAAWQSWTPTYANITVGNGTLIAKYVQIGKTVHFRWQLVVGSTTTLATDATISLPVAAHADYATTNLRTTIGNLRGIDAGTANFYGTVFTLASATVMTLAWPTSTSPRDDGTFPWTEAATDALAATGTYEAAA